MKFLKQLLKKWNVTEALAAEVKPRASKAFQELEEEINKASQ